MTIEERASNVVRNVFHKEFWNDKVDADMRQIKNLMTEFAIEQQEIDTQRAVEWLKDELYNKYNNKILGSVIDGFIQQFEQAMKGQDNGN